jgi:hypothetical protein
MDVPVTPQPGPAKLPWTPPAVKRVPIVSHTQHGASFHLDAGGLDDSGS